MTKSTKLSKQAEGDLLSTLQNRFEKNMQRHPMLQWKFVQDKILAQPNSLLSLQWMEASGGEPDVVVFNESDKAIYLIDCSLESPPRRSLCYDDAALMARKENKPKGSAVQFCVENGLELVGEDQYIFMQSIEGFDLKTSSWLLTSAETRKLGGAIFGDRRYNRCFIYHNGAESYYAARGFRAVLKL